MSKINQIQRALLELGGAEFQKLAEHYIHRKGWGPVIGIGSVLGTNKTRTGTPDVLMPRPDGRYAFAEVTTQAQKNGLEAKLLGDLEKCLDEDKTGIPAEKIERVILVSTEELPPASIERLRNRGAEAGVAVEPVGPTRLSYELLDHYPGLTRDHLGIEVGTGQILPLDEFVERYGKSSFATSLGTPFVHREEMLAQSMESLEKGMLLVLSGAPGAGKSRLAVEAVRKYTETHADCTALCIFNSGQDLDKDLRDAVAAPGHYLLFVDDANRLAQFDYIIHQVVHRREDQTFRIIATVRDYARARVMEGARPLPIDRVHSVQVNLLTSEEIADLLRASHGIENGWYHEHISRVAKGNPRLAVMMGEVAAREQSFDSIRDVSGLYDLYYASALKDLAELGRDAGFGGDDVLRVAGIVAMMRTLDRSNEGHVSLVRDAFGEEVEGFWHIARRLDQRELLDMHENEVVRVADQVLSTYLLYRALFVDQVLRFERLFSPLFAQRKSLLLDALAPLLNAFDSDRIVEAMRPVVLAEWDRLEADGDVDRLLPLVQDYWFVQPARALVVVRDLIDKTESRSLPVDQILFKAESQSHDAILNTLRRMTHSGERLTIVKLLVRYAERRPDAIPGVIDILTDDFGLQHDSARYGLQLEKQVLDELWRLSEYGGGIAVRLFVIVASAFLRTQHQTSRLEGENQFVLRTFDFPDIPEAIELRSETWERLFRGFQRRDLAGLLPQMLSHYASGHHGGSASLSASDAAVVLPKLDACLTPNVFEHDFIAQSCLDVFEQNGVVIPHPVRGRFAGEAFRVYRAVCWDYFGDRAQGESMEAFDLRQSNQLRAFLKPLDSEDLARVLTLLAEVRQALVRYEREHEVEHGVAMLLREIERSNPALHAHLIQSQLALGNPLELSPWNARVLATSLGLDDTLDRISSLPEPQQTQWRLHAYGATSDSELTPEQVARLIDLYRAAPADGLGLGLGELMAHFRRTPGLLRCVVDVLVERSEGGDNVSHVLRGLFNASIYNQEAPYLDLLAVDEDLVFRAYLAAGGRVFDVEKTALGHLVDRDPSFLRRYVLHVKGEWGREGGGGAMVHLWSRDDAETLLEDVLMGLVEADDHEWTLHETFSRFFIPIKGAPPTPELQARQDAFLCDLVMRHKADKRVMARLAITARDLGYERQRGFLACFLRVNREPKLFRRYALSEGMSTWSGSRVPLLNARIDYLRSLLPLVEGLDYIDHRAYVEREIASVEERIVYEKKRDFMRD